MIFRFTNFFFMPFNSFKLLICLIKHILESPTAFGRMSIEFIHIRMNLVKTVFVFINKTDKLFSHFIYTVFLLE